MRQREFTEVRRELEEIISKLKEATDTSLRQQLLRQMRRLLAEADSVLKSHDQSSLKS
jgi:hypothetical protein